MIKNIFISKSGGETTFPEYLDFAKIPYINIDLWTYEFDEFGGHHIPDELLQNENNLLVINHDTFRNFFSWDVGVSTIVEFSKRNYIWLWNDGDGLVNKTKTFNTCLSVPHLNYANITTFDDGQDLKNNSPVSSAIFPINHFMTLPRIKLGAFVKSHCCHDFLLTTIIRPARQHREILVNSLDQRVNLKSRGLIANPYRQEKNIGWIGDRPTQHRWADGFPSMDLYNQCWFEIAPETLYHDGYFYTEKTNKPIATKTPFLTVSTKGYLGYLKSLGFKTFESLINESYDQHDSIEDRVRLMLDQAEDIIANGSEQFYHAAKPILDHNYNHLAEISGKWDHLMDAFITQQLERIGFKL